MAMMATATRLSTFCLQLWHSRPAENVGVDTGEGDCATASLMRKQADSDIFHLAGVIQCRNSGRHQTGIRPSSRTAMTLSGLRHHLLTCFATSPS